MKNTLICTIGISLLNNLSWLGKSPKSDDQPRPPIYQAFIQEDWEKVALELLKEAPTARLCGAEINSIASIVNSGHIGTLVRLIFLISDTPEAEHIGEILKYYYTHSNNPIQFEFVDSPVTLIGLNADSPERFQREGLKSLVSKISMTVNEYGSEAIAINATGGYKAQISFAGMIGQALDIPVYYLFEGFSEAIELPPQPVSLDLTLWLTHYPLLSRLDANEAIQKSAAIADDSLDVLSALVDDVEIDGVNYLELSAMGKLFYYRCQFQYKKREQDLLRQIPKTDIPIERKKISLRADHGDDILMKFSQKIRRSPYVEGVINSLPFNRHQRSPVRRVTKTGLIEFVLTWTDPGYGICIQSTARGERDTALVAHHLEKEYGQ